MTAYTHFSNSSFKCDECAVEKSRVKKISENRAQRIEASTSLDLPPPVPRGQKIFGWSLNERVRSKQKNGHQAIGLSLKCPLSAASPTRDRQVISQIAVWRVSMKNTMRRSLRSRGIRPRAGNVGLCAMLGAIGFAGQSGLSAEVEIIVPRVSDRPEALGTAPTRIHRPGRRGDIAPRFTERRLRRCRGLRRRARAACGPVAAFRRNRLFLCARARRLSGQRRGNDGLKRFVLYRALTRSRNRASRPRRFGAGRLLPGRSLGGCCGIRGSPLFAPLDRRGPRLQFHTMRFADNRVFRDTKHLANR